MMRSGLRVRDASAEPAPHGSRVVIVSLRDQVHSRSRSELSQWLPGAVIGNYIAHDSFTVLATSRDILIARDHPSIAHGEPRRVSNPP